MALDRRLPTADCGLPTADRGLPTADCRLGLYVHIPFCSAICNYCNFNRGLFDAAQKARYVEALLAEIEAGGRRAGTAGEAADTIYLRRRHAVAARTGRGRVASSPPAARRSIVAPDAEITLEANPESVDEARLAAFRRAGVNRLSFGVQSFREDGTAAPVAAAHGRTRHVWPLARRAAAGFDNLSLDLMMWLPEQRVDQWLESVDAAIALRPDHLSLYLLEVYPNAPLKDDMARARWSQAPDDDAAAMYMAAMERLESAGYEQYEISNVAKPGRRSRHNLKYWTDGEWLGFGCGAHTTRDGVSDEECLRHRRVHRLHRRRRHAGASKSAGCPARNASATRCSPACG